MLEKKIKEALSIDRKGKTLLLMVGNDLRHDDAFGPELAERLDFLAGELCLINAGMHPENTVDAIMDFAPDKLIVFDAADFGASPGTLSDIPEDQVPQSTLSTHSFPLPVITRMAASEKPCAIHYIGVQAENLSLGTGISPSVREAISEIVNFYKKEINDA